jgi:tetratricopeptide (TPR) repeat protein
MRLQRFSMLAKIFVVLVLVQTLSVSNSFLGVLDQHNAFGEISGNVTSLTEKAVALNSLGRFDEAIAYLDKALSIDPNNVLALINKGVSLDGLGRF